MSEQEETRLWKIEEGEPRWRIAKWPRAGREQTDFVQGPVILPADESLRGRDWVNAATVEVAPQVDLTQAQQEIERLRGALDRFGDPTDEEVEAILQHLEEWDRLLSNPLMPTKRALGRQIKEILSARSLQHEPEGD